MRAGRNDLCGHLDKRHAARGCCNRCYKRLNRSYPTVVKANTFLEDYDFFRGSGFSFAGAALRLGISESALERRLLRAGRRMVRR